MCALAAATAEEGFIILYQRRRAMLIDYDVHSNYGNWMYNAGVGNDPRDRKFHISWQAERYDPNNTYQKTWLQTTLF